MQIQCTRLLHNRRIQLMLGILALSILVRIFFLEFYWIDTNATWDDEPVYLIIAEYIKSGESLINEHAPNTRPLLLSILISPLLDLNIHWIRVVLVLISSLTPILIFYLVKKAFGFSDIQALLPSVIWIFYPPAIWYSGLILTDSLTSLLVTLTVLSITIMKSSSKTYFVILTGVVIGCLILARSSYIYLPICLIGASVYSKLILKKNWIDIKKWLLIIVVIGVTTSPVIIRNYNTIGSILPIESRLSYGLVLSNGDLTSEIIKLGGYDKSSSNFIRLNELNHLETSYPELNSYAISVVFEELRTNTIMIPQILTKRTLNYWGSRPDPFEPRITTNDIILGIIWIPILVLFMSALRFYRSSNFWIFLILILYSYVTTIIFWSSPRFRFPTDSLIIILASVSILRSSPLIRKFTHLNKLKS